MTNKEKTVQIRINESTAKVLRELRDNLRLKSLDALIDMILWHTINCKNLHDYIPNTLKEMHHF